MEALEKAKVQLLDRKVFEHVKVHGKHINIIDLENVQIGTNIITLDKKVMNRLLLSLGFTPSFLSILFTDFKDNKSFLNKMLERFKSKRRDQEVILIYNMDSKRLGN